MSNFFNLVNIIINIAMVAGGIAAFKYGYKRAIAEVQDRVITTLEAELKEIRLQLADVRIENIRLNHTLGTIIDALAKSGIYITIQADMITIENSHDGSVHVTRITEEH